MKPVPVHAPLLNVFNNGTHRAQALPMVRVTVAELAMVGELSRQSGWESCAMTFAHDGQNIADAAQSLWKNPRYAELEAIRKPDHQPCAARCGRCSRCVHSAAWWSRGGRPYLGIAGEAALAADCVTGACTGARAASVGAAS